MNSIQNYTPKTYLTTLDQNNQIGNPKTYLKIQLQNKEYKGISLSAMRKLFKNHSNYLSAGEGRQLYNTLAQVNKKYSFKALNTLQQHPLSIAEAACKTRRAARAFIREKTSEKSRRAAEYLDQLRGGELDQEQIFQKYHYDPLKIIEAASRTNKGVNFFVDYANYLPEAILHPLLWAGVKTGVI